MHRKLRIVSVVALGAALLGSGTVGALAAPDGPCSVYDQIVKSDRDCAEGPSAEAMKYLVREELGKYRVADGFEAYFANSVFPTLWTATDAGDAAYDEDQDADWIEAWLNLFKLLYTIVCNADQYLFDVGTTGWYDGTITNPANGTSAPAILHLGDDGRTSRGVAWVMDDTLVLDGGFCSDLEVPVIALAVNATNTAWNAASGSTTRTVSIFGLLNGSVDIDFAFVLEAVNREMLTATIDISTPFPSPCADQHLTGSFTRRNDELLAGVVDSPACTGCDDGETECDNVCVDLESDRSHCGVCGNACSSAEDCLTGSCENLDL
jgi:hypothetical protein